MPPECEEVVIYEQLHQLDPASPNHTLPCDIIRLEALLDHAVTVSFEKVWHYPDRLRWGLLPFLDFFRQVIEVTRLEGICECLKADMMAIVGSRCPTS